MGGWMDGWTDRWMNLPSTSYQPQQSLVGEGECELSTHTLDHNLSPSPHSFCSAEEITPRKRAEGKPCLRYSHHGNNRDTDNQTLQPH